MRGFLLRNLDTALLVAGGLMVNAALVQGAGLNLGWWGWLFWAGIGLMWASIKVDS